MKLYIHLKLFLHVLYSTLIILSYYYIYLTQTFPLCFHNVPWQLESLWYYKTLDSNRNARPQMRSLFAATGAGPYQPVYLQLASVHGRAGAGEHAEALQSGHLHTHSP